ncbi:MAG: DUF6504 family protein [Dermatophilus congolensis]|nr:DUF6504 family protein [Dermatophilus congolensis]
MRVYGDHVDVVLREGVAAPTAFVWRGRRYAVREVLDSWVERTPWWRAVLTGDAGESAPRMQEQVWRVEAGRSASRAGGVYDLACAESGGWRLRRVAD